MRTNPGTLVLHALFALALPFATSAWALQDPGEGEGEAGGRGGEARAEEGEAPAAEPEQLYPAARRETTLRYYCLDGEVDEERLDEALMGLDDVDTLLLFGPEQHEAKPYKNFIVMETGAGVEGRDLERALKRSRCKVERLEYLIVFFKVEPIGLCPLQEQVEALALNHHLHTRHPLVVRQRRSGNVPNVDGA